MQLPWPSSKTHPTLSPSSSKLWQLGSKLLRDSQLPLPPPGRLPGFQLPPLGQKLLQPLGQPGSGAVVGAGGQQQLLQLLPPPNKLRKLSGGHSLKLLRPGGQDRPPAVADPSAVVVPLLKL